MFFVCALISLFVASVLQGGELVRIFGVKPNLVLVLLSTFSLFAPSFFGYALLSLFAVYTLQFAPGTSWEGWAMLLVAMIFFYAREKFFTPGLFANTIFITLGTILLYLFLEPGFLYHEAGIALFEVVLNACCGVLVYWFVNRIHEAKKRSSI